MKYKCICVNEILKILIVCFCIIISVFCLCVKNVFALIIPDVTTLYTDCNCEDIVDKYIYDYDIIVNGYIPKTINVGDSIFFGKFEKKPIEWMVLDKKDEKVLIITKLIIKTLPYNRTWNPSNWKDCTMRKWLNEDFYDISFNETEKMLINETTISDKGSIEFNILPCDETIDKVFILNIEEANKYFKNDKARQTVGNESSIKEGLWVSNIETSKGYCVWWLINPGKNRSYAALVHAGGGVGHKGDGVAVTGNGIRPCLWVSVK